MSFWPAPTSDLQRAAAQAAKYGVPFSGNLESVLALPELELVVNLTIPAVHASVALQAIRVGKHVYGEKPFALSVQEAQSVIASATEYGVHLGSAPDTFLGAGLQTARRLIEEGRIGKPISAKAIFGYPGPDAWHPNPEFLFQEGGGPLLDMGVYYLTALVQMFGPVKTVCGFGSRSQDKRSVGSGARAGESFSVAVDTEIAALLEFASGPIATATFSFDAPIATRELQIQGTEAVIRLPDPNRFDGSVFLCKKEPSKVTPEEWISSPKKATGLRYRLKAAPKVAEWGPSTWPELYVAVASQEPRQIWQSMCWMLWNQSRHPQR